MSNHPRSRRPGSAAPGAKVLLTAAALAGTLLGWGALARKDQSVAALASTGLAAELPPLPTLVAPPKTAGLPLASGPSIAAAPLRRVSAPSSSAGISGPVTVTRSSR